MAERVNAVEEHTSEQPASAPVMTCAECGHLAGWNPTGYCTWSCYGARPRDPEAAPLALAYFFGLGSPTQLNHPRNP